MQARGAHTTHGTELQSMASTTGRMWRPYIVGASENETDEQTKKDDFSNRVA